MEFSPLLAHTVDRPLPILRCGGILLTTILLGTGMLSTQQFEERAIAQVLPDMTLPTNSAVSENGTVTDISGGTVSGNYLFHSFETFSILEGNTARFNNATTIDSIITRVTGSNESMINGILEAQGSADFFLLNPNGLVFGPNAQLNIGGSFIGSSAESITFDDGSVFSAVNPQTPPLLTINSTIGLQYGSTPGPLTIQGNGNNLVLDEETFDVVLTDRPSGLQVETGQTLALIGGDISIDGGNITAVSGRIILGSVADSTVTFQEENNDWSVDFSNGVPSGIITLSNAASVLTSGEDSAEIFLNGEVVNVTGGSALLANTLGNGDAVGIAIQASDSVRTVGAVVDSDGEAIFPTSILAEVAPEASGAGGDIIMATPRLRIAGGAQVSTSTLGRGDAGDIRVVSERINIVNGAGMTPSGLFVNVLNPDTTGNGGDLSITAQRLNITGGAEVAANTFGVGNAGTINLNVEEINVLSGAFGLGASGIFAQAATDATGTGGSIVIETEQLQLMGGAIIDVTTFSAAPAGTLEVIADRILIEGLSPLGDGSAISAIVNEEASGQGGSISINTQQLELTNGGQLITSTLGGGDAGFLEVNADQIVLIGGRDMATVISSAVEETGTGQGGTLIINTDTLHVMEGAQISTGTRGNGPGGDLTVQAQTIDIEGRNNLARSGIIANALEGNGAGGNLNIETDTLSVRRNGVVTASNFATVDTINAGKGPAGNVTVQAQRIELDEGQITASTAVGDQGNVVLDSRLLVLSDRSAITTNAAGADGGNISIDTENLVAFNNSDITANANQGLGGQVSITASGLFGIQFRNSLTPRSDITVTSSLGPQFNGVVELNTPDVDPLQGIISLPHVLLDPNTQVIAACEQFRGNELILTGRGGLPTTATQFMNSTDIWQDFRLGKISLGGHESDAQTAFGLLEPVPSSPLVEAQSWQVDKNGYVMLMAPSSVEHRSPITQGVASCN